MNFLSPVIAAGIEQTLKKVNEGFISMIAEKYDIDSTELEELFEVAVEEVAKKMKIKKPKKKKGTKKMSGWSIFSKAERAKIKVERAELSFGETSKEIGTRWQRLSYEEKAEYNLRANAENEKRNKNEKKTKENKNEKKQKKNQKSSEEESSPEIDEERCVALLQTGKRKGDECGAKLAENSEKFCKRHNKPKARKQNKNEKKTKQNKEKQDEMTIPTEDEIDSSYSSEIDELIIEEEEEVNGKGVHFSDEDEVRIIGEDPTEYVGTGLMRRRKPRDPTVRHTSKSRSVDTREDRWD